MPRIYKGSENTLKLLVHTCEPNTIDNLKIVLFTDDPNSAAEFYSDSITIEGNIVSLKVNAWSFDNMNEGVINYIASGELGNDTFLTERQSNYYLKSPNNYTPTTPDFNDYYTKTEVDDMLEDIEVDVDLTGYATEQWVRQQGYVTDSDVNDYVGNEIGQLEEIINTKQDKLVSGTNIKTINGESIIGEGDITIEGGGSGSSEDEGIYVLETLEPIEYREWRVNQSDFTEEVILSTTVKYNSDTERVANNLEVINAILEGKCKALYYKHLTSVYTIDQGVTDGYNYYKYGNKYEYIPFSWEFPLGAEGTTFIDFYGIIPYGNTVNSLKFRLNKATGKMHNKNIWDINIGERFKLISVKENNEYKMYGSYFDDIMERDFLYKARIDKTDGTYTDIILAGGYGDSTINERFVYGYTPDGLIYIWTFSGDVNQVTPTIIDLKTSGSGGSGDVDLSNYYTKEETDNLIDNSSVMLETTDDGVLTYSQIKEIENNWTNAYIAVHWSENNVSMTEYVGVTSLYISDTVSTFKSIHLEGICKGYLFTWDIKYSATEGALVRTPISESDSSTIEDIVATEVSEQLTNNLKTINGESLLGEGDIVIEANADSGVYVLDYVGEYQVMYEENNWASVTNHVYADSERQEHNAEVYQAWKEGKIKALYYKHVENTFVDYGKTLQYQLVPCTVTENTIGEDETEYKCMGITALYKKYNQYDATDIYSTMFSLNEDGSLRGEYDEGFHMQYEEIGIGDVYHDVEGLRLDKHVAINYIGGGWRSCEVEINSETTNERVSLNYIKSNDFGGENNTTVTLYGTLSNGSIIKWDFSAQNGDIIDEYAYAQIIPMEVDLSSYYTKEEVDQLLADLDLTDYYTKAETDELISNINLGDSSTISSIVSTEVSNQLTDNFKTINGETIIGEGDIVIEGGADVDLNNYYTKEETDTAISEGKRIGILECIEQLYDFKNDAWIQYGEDDRQSHNATVIQNALNGAYDIVVYKYFFEQANSQNVFIYVPLTFRYPSHDGYFRATGLLEPNEYAGSSSAKLIHMMMNNDGSVNSFGVDDVNLLSSGSGGDMSNLGIVTIQSFTVQNECYFNNGEASVDNASGIATAFKVGRIATNKLWVNELHMPNGGTEVGKINFTTTNYNVPENTTDSEKIVASIDAEGNIYEGTTKLSEKYAGKGFIRDTDNTVNYGYEDSAIVAYASSHLEKSIVAKSWNEGKALFVNMGGDVKKQIPVSIEAKYNSDVEIVGYEVWGWYSKTQTITWVFDENSTSVTPTIE